MVKVQLSVGGQNWICPTRADRESIIGTSRAGSTVNGTANCRFIHATVADVADLILFPDGTTITAISIDIETDKYNLTSSTAFTDATVSLEQWSAFEAAGCVFLPAAGNYYLGSVSGVDIYGGYWSSAEDVLPTRTSSTSP